MGNNNIISPKEARARAAKLRHVAQELRHDDVLWTSALEFADDFDWLAERVEVEASVRSLRTP